MLEEMIILILMTFIPFLELRASIPYGILVLHMNWFFVFVVCVIANIVLGPVLYLFLDKFIHLFLKINAVGKCYNFYIKRTQKKIKKYVDKYGLLGVSIFIGIPLPGSGVYSAALGSYLLGLEFRKFIMATILGVLIAGILVAAIVLSGSAAFGFFIKVI